MAEIRLSLAEAKALPGVCMECGDPATDYVDEKMTWWPRWTYFFLFVHPFLWGLLAWLCSKSALIEAPFCARHRDHWERRRRFVFRMGNAIFGLLVAFIFGAIWFRMDGLIMSYIIFLGGVVLIGSWIGTIIFIHHTAIRPRVITRDEIVIQNVAEELVQAVLAADRRAAKVARTEALTASPPDTTFQE